MRKAFKTNYDDDFHKTKHCRRPLMKTYMLSETNKSLCRGEAYAAISTSDIATFP